MIRPSPEILAVSRRWYNAVPHDENVLRNLLSDRNHLRFVGTADGEVWSGGAVRDGIGEFFGVIPAVLKYEETFAEAYENGETGWSCFTHDIVFANQPDRPFCFRTTLIFALEDGAWKIVQRHASVPISNMELMKTEQTAIADLVAAAQEGFALDQREGLATIMFTDIVNSSGLAAAMGDRLWTAEIARHFGTLRDIIEGGGGQFVKSLGDGTMSSFPAPNQALQAAQSILRTIAQSDGPAISLRIGIHSGDVVQSEDDFFGTVVNKAARIAAMAEPGTILVSDATRALGEASDMRFGPPETVSLRGLEGEHQIHRLEWRE